MKIKIDRLDEINSALKNTDGTDNSLNMDDIFHTGFMSKYTQFSSIQEMLDKSGFAMAELNGLQKNADPTFDSFVEKTTNFSCRNEMITCGGKEFLKSKTIDI